MISSDDIELLNNDNTFLGIQHDWKTKDWWFAFMNRTGTVYLPSYHKCTGFKDGLERAIEICKGKNK